MDEGIALLPTSLIYNEVKSSKLVRILPEWRSALSPVHFVYPVQRFVTPKLSSFMEQTFTEFKKNFETFEL